jgi:triacylglycerol lipase
MKTFVLIFIIGFQSVAIANSECVVLLHGWAQITNSMGKLEKTLTRAGYYVANTKYSSRRYGINELANDTIERGFSECRKTGSETIHIVTHSLGGILLRVYLEHEKLGDLGKVVMLGPPNQGSEIIDGLRRIPGFKLITGPTLTMLGTGHDSISSELGAIHFNVGIIAGDTNLNPLNYLFRSGPSDSVVSVESTRVEGMNAHLVLPVTHQLMMRDNEVIDHAIHYLKTGSFMPAY